MPSRHFQPAISSTSLPPVRQIVVINSKTESKGDGPYLNDDEELITENQAGLPESQYGVAKSSPPLPASDNINHNVSNNNGEFFLKERYARTEFSVS
jgi:hypothetical protein